MVHRIVPACVVFNKESIMYSLLDRAIYKGNGKCFKLTYWHHFWHASNNKPNKDVPCNCGEVYYND